MAEITAYNINQQFCGTTTRSNIMSALNLKTEYVESTKSVVMAKSTLQSVLRQLRKLGAIINKENGHYTVHSPKTGDLLLKAMNGRRAYLVTNISSMFDD